MKLTLTGRHFEITPHLRQHVERKSRKLDRFSEHIIEGEFILFKDHVYDIAEGKLHLRHAVITAKGKGTDMYLAISDLIDKLVTRLRRHEGKLRDRKRISPPDKVASVENKTKVQNG